MANQSGKDIYNQFCDCIKSMQDVANDYKQATKNSNDGDRISDLEYKMLIIIQILQKDL